MAEYLVGPQAKEWRSQAPILHWRERLSPGSFRTYYPSLVGFCKSVSKTPEQLIEWAKGPVDEYEVLDEIQKFILNMDGSARHATKQVAYASIRSYMMHNRVNLPRDPSFRIRSDTPPVERKLTIDNLKELIGLATQPMRSMLLVKWQGILDTESLIYVSQTQSGVILDALEKNQKTLRLNLPGRKHQRNLRPYYTFIGHDALESLREYFDRVHKPKPGEPVWVWQKDQHPISNPGFGMAWLRLLRKAKLIPKNQGSSTARYGFNVHNTRDLAISLLNTVPGLNPKCIEFWAGHDIDPLGYNQFYSTMPDYVVKQYGLTEPYLNIISAPQMAEAEEVKDLREQISELKLAVRMLQDASGLKVVPQHQS